METSVVTTLTPRTLKAVRSPGHASPFMRRLLADRVTLACLAILLIIALAAIFAGHLAPADPLKTSMAKRLKPIGAPGFWLGSDELGRDMLSRLIYGGRMSLLMGTWPVLNALIVGGALGVVAGYAGRASGAGAATIIRVHVLPNVLGPIVVYASGLFSVSIILASGLSFLGLGVEPPQAEWGLMLNTLRQAIYVQPWVAILPGAMIFATSICFNLASDGLRAAMELRT